MELIADYGTYTNGMRKSMGDKTWFLNMIGDATTILDYGCADGALLEYIRDAMPGVFDLIGIDIDERMLKLAAERLNDGSHAPIKLMSPDSFEEEWGGKSPYDVCLNCGSVVHEVYSYGTPESIEKFWDFVFNKGFGYIAIRDMALSKIDICESWSVVDETMRKMEKFHRKRHGARRRFTDYLNYIGADHIDVTTWRDLVHYLLKYRYETNWEREMRENYLPLLTEEILLKIPRNYRVKHYEHYTLPFLKDQVMADFGIDLKTRTHYKLLLERID